MLLFFVLFTALASAAPTSYEYGVPRYQQTQPRWSFALTYAPGDWGPSGDNQGDETQFEGAHTQMEYHLPWQSAGVLSFGASISGYFSSRDSRSPFTASLGGLLRYQARFSPQQVVVPSFGITAEYWRYQLPDQLETVGQIWRFGPMASLWISLNKVDRSTASFFYADHGIIRTYLVTEMTLLKGKIETLSFDGPAVYAGLRFEW